MNRVELKLNDDDLAKLDDLVRERQSRHHSGVVSRVDIIRMLIRAEWLAQHSPRKEPPGVNPE